MLRYYGKVLLLFIHERPIRCPNNPLPTLYTSHVIQYITKFSKLYSLDSRCNSDGNWTNSTGCSSNNHIQEKNSEEKNSSSLNNLKSIKSLNVKECCDKLTFSIGKNYHIFYMLYSAFLGIWTQVNYLQSKIYNTVFVSRLEYKMENLFIIN